MNLLNDLRKQLEAAKKRPRTVGLIVDVKTLRALCEYVEAREELGAMRVMRAVFHKQKTERLKAELQGAFKRFQQTRAALGLEVNNHARPE